MSTWDTLGGTWTDSANWIGGVPNGIGDVATFGFSSNLGLSLVVGILETSVIRLGVLNVSLTGTTGLTIRGSAGDTGTGVGRLILNGGALDAVVTRSGGGAGDLRISSTNGLRVELETNTVFDIGNLGTIFVDAPILGSGALIKRGSGNLELTGTNTFTGGVRVEAGRLYADSTALGASTITFAPPGATGAILYSSGTIANTIATLAGGSGAAVIDGNLTLTGALSHLSDGRFSFNDIAFGGTIVASFSAILGNGTASNFSVGSGTLRFGDAYNAANLFNLPGAGFTQIGDANIGDTGTLDLGGFATTVNNLKLIKAIVQSTGGPVDLTINNASGGASGATFIGTVSQVDRLIVNIVGNYSLTATFNTWISTDIIQLNGNALANTITGSSERDTINGNDGDDILAGGGAPDTIDGGNGNDIVSLNATNDGSNVAGGANTDTLRITGDITSIGTISGFEALELQNNSIFQTTAAKFAGGFAINSLLSGTGTIIINLALGDQTLLIRTMTVAGGASIDLVVNGSTGVDVIKAPIGTSNSLNGNAGNDQLNGGNLADLINGGADIDKIRGDGGADTLTGGTGADVFKYRAAADSTLVNPDTITDFLSGTDRINFVKIDANASLAGDQAFSFLGTAVFTNTGLGQIRWVDLGADLRVEVDVDGNGVADMHILLQGAGAQVLTVADFVL
jgi:autotransporter-associated beta strand protein